MNKIIKTNTTGSVVIAGDQEDPFAVVFAPARPTLIAARKLRPALRLIGAPMLNVKRAAENRDAAIERFELIPEDTVLYGAMKLFEEAQQKPAPEPWLHTAIGIMLDSMPGAESLPPSFRFGLVDLMMNDDDICGDYEPGFSYAVVTKAVREVRRTTESVPNQAAFLKACVKHRAGFGKLASLAEQLIEVRQNAEDVLIETGDVKVPEDEFWGLDNKEMKLAVETVAIWRAGGAAADLIGSGPIRDSGAARGGDDGKRQGRALMRAHHRHASPPLGITFLDCLQGASWQGRIHRLDLRLCADRRLDDDVDQREQLHRSSCVVLQIQFTRVYRVVAGHPHDIKRFLDPLVQALLHQIADGGV